MAQASQNNNDDYTAYLLSRAFVWSALALLCVGAAYIRIHGVQDYHYNADEILHIDIAKGATLREVLDLSRYEGHPPLGNLLRHYWLTISDEPWFMRAEALLFGLLLIPLYYRMGKTLGGEMTGIMAALLITFSQGCIAQSYIVRDYTLCVFCISLGFYSYLRWREEGHQSALLLYGVCFALAEYTTLMAAYAVACIAAAEFVWRWRHKTKPVLPLLWALIHLYLILLAVMAYWPSLPLIEVYRSTSFPFSDPFGLLKTLLYPMFALQQMLPERLDSAWALPSFCFAALLLGLLALRVRDSRLYFLQLLFALALGMALMGTGLYPFANSRHVLWSLPFVILPTAWALSELCRKFGPKRQAAMVALVALAIGFTYSPAERFSQLSEYPMPEDQWQALTQYLKGLSRTHLILAGKSDMFALDPPGQNPYHFFGNNAFTGASQAALIPYYSTYILFDPYGYRLRTDRALLRMASEAHDRGMLDGVSDVTLVNTMWRSPAIVDLMLCPTLKKTIVTFPQSAPNHVFTREELYRFPAALLVVSKQDFLKDVVSASGKARACFSKTYE